jgi:hypothetical protein
LSPATPPRPPLRRNLLPSAPSSSPALVPASDRPPPRSHEVAAGGGDGSHGGPSFRGTLLVGPPRNWGYRCSVLFTWAAAAHRPSPPMLISYVRHLRGGARQQVGRGGRALFPRHAARSASSELGKSVFGALHLGWAAAAHRPKLISYGRRLRGGALRARMPWRRMGLMAG